MKKIVGLFRVQTVDDKFWKYATIVSFILSNILFLILALCENFGYDEAYTVGMVERSVSDIIDIASHDVHTPFYYLLLKLFYTSVGGRQLVSVKLFSWLFTVAYMILGWYICRKHYEPRVAFFWILFSGFMPAMVIQSSNVRMYTLGIFMVTLAGYLAYSLWQQETKGNWILFTLVTIMAVYTHTFCMITMVVIYGLFLALSLIKKCYKKLCNILLSGGVVSIAYIPWLVILWGQFRRWAGWESGWGNTIDELSLKSLYSYLAEWFSSLENPQPFAIAWTIVVLSGASVGVIKYVRKNKDWLPCLGVIVAAIVFGVAMLVSLFIVPCFLGRYLFWLFGGLWLFVAVGVSRFKYVWTQCIVIIGVVICGAFAFAEEMRLEDGQGLAVYRECIESRDENDVIMMDSYFQMIMSIYEPDEEYMLYGLKSEVLPFKNCQSFISWEQLEGVDTVWYLSFKDFKRGNIDEYYECEYRVDIPYSYYNIVLEKMTRK